MAKHDAYERRRVLYISPVGVALVVTLAILAGLFASEFFRTVGSSRGMDLEGVGWGAASALVGSVISAFAFNIVAPMVGGFPLWLGVEKPTRAGEE